MEKTYKLLTDTIFIYHSDPIDTYLVLAGTTVYYHDYEDRGIIRVKVNHGNGDYWAYISNRFLEVIQPPAPIDRAAWLDGINQVMGYLPAISENVWQWMQETQRPLYDGLKTMLANGPDNDL